MSPQNRAGEEEQSVARKPLPPFPAFTRGHQRCVLISQITQQGKRIKVRGFQPKPLLGVFFQRLFAYESLQRNGGEYTTVLLHRKFGGEDIS